jgi:trans-2,3-dihydro-3-hydroxyanthranilate isomerase
MEQKPTRRFAYATVDVFADQRFGGNPLAVFVAADGLDDAEMQALAAEMNYSETTFVLPPTDPANSARVRIFNRTSEMPFAGHPNVGTAYVLARLNPDTPDMLLFEEIAGLVTVKIKRDPDRTIAGAEIDAPQPLQLFGDFPPEPIAACLGLRPADLCLAHHPPTWAGVGMKFLLVEVAQEALPRAVPDLAAFRRAANDRPDEASDRLPILLYARTGQAIRARMFAPLSGTWEDPATGSANAALAAFLLSLDGGDTSEFDVTQGVEMGRPSLLKLRAFKASDGIRASVAGRCVPVFQGVVEL